MLDSDKTYASANIVNKCDKTDCPSKWHSRLGHRHLDAIKKLVSENLASGIKLNSCCSGATCEVCIKSKITQTPFPKLATHRATRNAQIVHSDLCGPMSTRSVGGNFYFLTLIDDYSRYTHVHMITKKSEAIDKIQQYLATIYNRFGRFPEVLRSDGGGEYVSRELENYLKDRGVHHQLTIAHTPSQNGIAERKNRSLLEMTSTILAESGLPRSLWAEAVNTANYLQNRLPTKANDKTPFELWTDEKPDLSHIKTFGCKAISYIHESKRHKLDDRGEVGALVGYDLRSKGFRIYTGYNRVIVSRSVKFIENDFPYLNRENQNKPQEELEKLNDTPEDNETPKEYFSVDTHSNAENIDEVNKPECEEARRSHRSNKGVPPDRFTYITQDYISEDPKTFDDIKDINSAQEKLNWKRAMDDEINSLYANQTWCLVNPPPGKRIIGSRWTFKTKRNSSGETITHKARLVAKGYNQKYGVDYYETYAPVVSYTAIRSFFSMASANDLSVKHVDIKTAFLHGDLEEEVYMHQPEGYIKNGEEKKVCKLNKAIYGLKQAARAWNTKIAKTLSKLGFEQSKVEPCLFIRKEKQSKPTYVIVYVDDLLISGEVIHIDEVIKQLSLQYEIKDLGEASYYLGINVSRNKSGKYSINQKNKIEELVVKHGLENAKPCYTPLEPSYNKTNEETNLLPNNHEYRQAIGALLYISNITRPDVNLSVNLLSRRNENPRQTDWNQVKRTIVYLNTTKNLNLELNPEVDPIMTVYADADWGGNLEDRKSTSGSIFLLGNAPVHWFTKKQSVVALSSSEAEFIAAASASQDILWLVRILEDLGMYQKYPITLKQDNQSTMKMIESPKQHGKTKHIDMRECFVRDLVESGKVTLEYCPTSDMTADILTKPLSRPAFTKHRVKLQLNEHCAAHGGAC